MEKKKKVGGIHALDLLGLNLSVFLSMLDLHWWQLWHSPTWTRLCVHCCGAFRIALESSCQGLHPPLFLYLENIHPCMGRTYKATQNCDSNQQRRQLPSCPAWRTRICVMTCAASRGSPDFQPAILFMLKCIIEDLNYLSIVGWILVICLFNLPHGSAVWTYFIHMCLSFGFRLHLSSSSLKATLSVVETYRL